MNSIGFLRQINVSSNVRWDKLDKELYEAKLSLAVQHVDTNIDTVGALNNSVMKLNETLDNCARSAAPSKEKHPRKAKLRTWTPAIQTAVVAKKKAFFELKAAGRPDNKENQTVINNNKKTASLLRQVCRHSC